MLNITYWCLVLLNYLGNIIQENTFLLFARDRGTVPVILIVYSVCTNYLLLTVCSILLTTIVITVHSMVAARYRVLLSCISHERGE